MKDPRARIVFENAAQHLKRAGFKAAEAAHLLRDISTQKYEQLAAAAERRRPKLCTGARCTQRPGCPYCDACLNVVETAASAADIVREFTR